MELLPSLGTTRPWFCLPLLRKGDCQVLTVCEGEVVVTTTLASGLACHDTTDWKVYVRPTPTFTLTSEGKQLLRSRFHCIVCFTRLWHRKCAHWGIMDLGH